MRYLTILLALIVLAGPALAARPDARKMTCKQAKQLVLDRGAVVVTTGQYTYRRFVSNLRYCDYWEQLSTARTKTKDNPKCRIGYICEDRMDNLGFGFGRF